MAEVIILLALCCSSSSCITGLFYGGFIPGTKPHFLKSIKASKLLNIDTNISMGPSPGPSPSPSPEICTEMKKIEFADKFADYENDKVFSVSDFGYVDTTDALNDYLDVDNIAEVSSYCELNHS